MKRLMVLDDALAQPEMTWLATEAEKLAHVTLALGTRFSRADLPHLVFGRGSAQTIRYFPDRLPIGVHPDGRLVLVYLVTRPSPVDFRAFLHRHAELLRPLPAWTIRLLVPQHFGSAPARFSAAWREDLATPLRLSTVDELRWYFPQRRALAQDPEVARDPRFCRAHEAFVAPRFQALYRAWLVQGDAVLSGALSPILADAIARRIGWCTVRSWLIAINISPPWSARHNAQPGGASEGARRRACIWPPSRGRDAAIAQHDRAAAFVLSCVAKPASVVGDRVRCAWRGRACEAAFWTACRSLRSVHVMA